MTELSDYVKQHITDRETWDKMNDHERWSHVYRLERFYWPVQEATGGFIGTPESRHDIDLHIQQHADYISKALKFYRENKPQK